MKSLPMLIVWKIWCERNKSAFRNKETPMQQLMVKIIDKINQGVRYIYIYIYMYGAKDIARILYLSSYLVPMQRYKCIFVVFIPFFFAPLVNM